jgi:polyphosphate glucokinase
MPNPSTRASDGRSRARTAATTTRTAPAATRRTTPTAGATRAAGTTATRRTTPTAGATRAPAATPTSGTATARSRAAKAARTRTTGTTTRRTTRARRPINTLAIDIGGTGLKASVLNESGQMEHDRVRIATPYPLSPQKLVTVLEDLIKPLPAFDRVSVGFPGMVRGGHILSAPHFVSPDGPGGEPAPKLVKAWGRFDLESELTRVTGKPTKVANDADLQGAAVVKGKDFEVVLTLGTGVGTAFFLEGTLLPHFEFAHTPFLKSRSYNDWLGEAARKEAGNKKWKKRVLDAVESFRNLTFFDHCYLGGGNAARLTGDLPADVSIVDNSAGILGGIKLWERT